MGTALRRPRRPGREDGDGDGRRGRDVEELVVAAPLTAAGSESKAEKKVAAGAGPRLPKEVAKTET